MSEPLYQQLLKALEDHEPHRLVDIAHALHLEPRTVYDVALRLPRYGHDVEVTYLLHEGRRRCFIQLGKQERLFGRDAA